MHRFECLRVVVVVGAVVAALGSATSTSQQQPAPQYGPRPAQQQAQPQYTPCEHACGQVSRCNLQPYDACVAECRRTGTEQQPGGPEQLALITQASCAQLQSAMQGAGSAAPQTSPTSGDAGAIETDFATPLGYTESRQGQWVLFTPAQITEKTPCVYGVAPSRRSSGSLERDALAALLEPLAGWQRGQGEHTQQYGTAAPGWSYHWVRAGVQRMNNGSYEYMNAMAMAFPAGTGRVNIVFGYGSNVHCLADDASFGRLFYSLRPRGWTSDGGKALRANLIGGWRMDAGSGTMRATRIYLFRDDGRYVHAMNTTSQVGYTETWRTGAGDGAWSLRDDNQLVLTPDGKAAETFRVRLFDEKSHVGTWRKLAMLRDGSTESRELDFERTSWK